MNGLAHTWTVGWYHPIRQHYKPGSTSVLVYGVSLGLEASFMSILAKGHSGEVQHKDISVDVLIELLASPSMASFATQVTH